jgi:hypothetical protein
MRNRLRNNTHFFGDCCAVVKGTMGLAKMQSIAHFAIILLQPRLNLYSSRSN